MLIPNYGKKQTNEQSKTKKNNKQTNKHYLTLNVRFSADAKFVTVKLTSALSPSGMERRLTGEATYKRTCLREGVVGCVGCVTALVNIDTWMSNKFTSFTLTVFDCETAFTVKFHTSLVSPRDLIIT